MSICVCIHAYLAGLHLWSSSPCNVVICCLKQADKRKQVCVHAWKAQQMAIFKIKLDKSNWSPSSAGGIFQRRLKPNHLQRPRRSVIVDPQKWELWGVHVCLNVCMHEACSRAGVLPEHLSNCDPPRYSLWLLIIDWGTQTDTYTHSLHMLSCVPFTLMRNSPRGRTHTPLNSFIKATVTTSSGSPPPSPLVRKKVTFLQQPPRQERFIA